MMTATSKTTRVGVLTPCLVAGFLFAAEMGAQQSGGDGTLYMGTYAQSIYVIDEATMAVRNEIPLRTGIPIRMTLSQNRERFYTLDATFQHVEVVDIASERSVDNFTLSTGNRTVRMFGLNIDPQERFAIMLVKIYTKLADRFEISEPTLLKYDLATKTVTDTIPWPEDEQRERAQIIFSPDGDLIYFFADDILVLETEGFTEVDRWEYSQSLDEGMGRFSFGFGSSPYEDPGFYTGLFRITDPVQNRRMMGVARVNLAERDVEFYMLGPSESVSFSMAPGRRKAYGIHSEIGSYEFWEFDMEGRRVEGKTQFAGRPRMGLLPSSNGELLYIYNAGNTIDIYDADTFGHLRTVELDADMTAFVMLPPR